MTFPPRGFPSSVFAFLLTISVASLSLAESAPVPHWIWSQPERKTGETVCLQHTFQVEREVRQAHLVAASEYAWSTVEVNGQQVAQGEPYGPILRADVTGRLVSGENTLCICCRSSDGPAAAMARLELEFVDGTRKAIVTGPDWKAVPWGSFSGVPSRSSRDVVSLGIVDPHRWGLEKDTI